MATKNENTITLENSKTITLTSLDKGEKMLRGKGYKLGGGNPTGFMHMVAYSTRPITHADAVTIGMALFKARNIGVPFSKITTLHTTPASAPRIYKTNNLKRYSADFEGYFFGTVRFACATHGLNRTNCEKGCLQGLYDVASEKFLAELAGTYKPANSKPSKPKGKRKKASKPQVPNEAQNPVNVERMQMGDEPISDTVTSEPNDDILTKIETKLENALSDDEMAIVNNELANNNKPTTN